MCDNPLTVFYNPAAITVLQSLHLAGSFVEPFPAEENREYYTYSGVFGHSSYGVFAFSVNNYALGTSAITDETGPQIIGVDKSKARVYCLTYAHKVSQNLSVGGTFNYLDYQLSELHLSAGLHKSNGKSESFFINLGLFYNNLFPKITLRPADIPLGKMLRDATSYTLKQGVSLGLSLVNFGPQISFIDPEKADNLPTLISLGTAYHIVDCRAVGVILAIDLEKQVYENSVLDYIHLGGEYNFLQIFYIRAGYQWKVYSNIDSFQTTGFGLRVKFLKFDCARYAKGPQYTWHYGGSLSLEI